MVSSDPPGRPVASGNPELPVDDERIESETRQLYAEVELLRTVAEMTRLVSSEPDPLRGTLTRIGELAGRTLPGCEVGMSLRAGRDLESAASSGTRAAVLDGAQRDAGDGPCLEALATQREVRADLARLAQRWPDFAGAAAALHAREVVALPFAADGESQGALNVYVFEEGALDADALRAATVLADQASVAVANAQLYARAADLARHLTVAMESRGVIEQAKGILMLHLRASEEDAFGTLRRLSQDHNVKLRDLARDIVDHAVGGPHPDRVLPAELRTLLDGS